MPETQIVRIQCPNCGTPYETPIRSVIDVGQNPQLRQAFLAGQVNLAVCPKCGQGGMIEVPLVYHDPGAEFLAVYFPPQVQMAEVERQRMIGELTREVMRGLPPDQHRGYFLNPRQFVSRQSLMDAILGTMGVSQEELDRQRKKLRLIDQLLVMADDRKGLEMMIKGQDAQYDYEFFMLLSDTLARAQAAGDQAGAQRLLMLRDNLMQLTSWGKRAAKQQAAVESLRGITSLDQLLDRVISADPDEVDAIALAARPLMDYRFFEMLTARIEAAQGAERERLMALREHLLELTQKLDQVAKEHIKEAVDLLQSLLKSPSPRSAVRERMAEIDETFMGILSLNIEHAERRGSQELLARLMMIHDEIMDALEEQMPAELRLVSDLLSAPYPEGTRALLQERRDEITPEVLALMDRMAEDAGQQENEDSAGVAKRLRDIKAQALLLV